MFSSSLFGMNINLLKDNPDWRWFLPIAVTLILMAFGLWLLFDWAEPQLESWIKRLTSPRENPKYTVPHDDPTSLESSVV
jgi:p-aminobenzoyl-glutamate transporter AbgT